MASAATGPRFGVSRRTLIVGSVLVVLNTLFLVRWTCTAGGFPGGASLLQNAVTVLFVLTLANQGLRKWWPARALRPGEMLTIYALVGVATGLSGTYWDMGGILPAVITYPFMFASSGNGWRGLLWPYYPSWLTIRDPAALEGFYVGGYSYTWQVIGVWAVPAFWWTAFVSALMWVCLCLNSVLRRRWADEEKLAFPITILPVQLVEERLGLLRNKGWWVGLGAALTLGIWNALAGIVRSLPAVPTHFFYQPYLANLWPWKALTDLGHTVGWEPGFLGICYLMPLDLAFSLCAFAIFWAAEYLLCYRLGWTTSYFGFPYLDRQMSGALLALAIAIIWFDRRYLLQVLRRVCGLSARLGDDRQEALSYRTAVLGATAGLAFIWWFWVRAGVPGWIVAMFFALYLAITMVLCRVRAQVGVPNHELWEAMPHSFLSSAVGALALGPRTLTMFTLLNPYLLGCQGNNPTPLQLETLKMSEGGRMERRRIGAALALVVPITVICYFWAWIHFGYHLGLGTAKIDWRLLYTARGGAEGLAALLRQPTRGDLGAATALGIGAIVTWLLLFLKLRFLWWPLHPIAFPIAHSWMIRHLVPAIFVTWVLKLALMRYGGLRAHRAALPFFLGLTVGDFTAQMLRGIISQVLNIGLG